MNFENIRKGEEVVPCFGDVYAVTEFNGARRPNENKSVHMFVQDTKLIASPSRESYLWQYCNDAKRSKMKNNCVFEWRKVNDFPVVFLKAQTSIRRESDLLVSYGKTYWA